MNKTLKNNIKIHGFNNLEDISSSKSFWSTLAGEISYIYSGSVDKIPEELAKDCVPFVQGYGFRNYIHADYNGGSSAFDVWIPYSCNSAKDSIKTACSNEYCVIYKNVL